MTIRKLALTALLSASLMSTPVLAQTTVHQATPIERAGVEMGETNAQFGNFPFAIIFIVIGLVGIGVALGGNDPASP